MKAVSGNFTLSHARSHVGLPPELTHYLSRPPSAPDLPSGEAGVKQAAQVEEGEEEEEEGWGLLQSEEEGEGESD